MARPDEVLPGLGQRTLVPRPVSGPVLSQLHLSQEEGYVLSRVDGRTTLWEICLLVPLRREQTLRILRRLRAEGIIEIPGSLEPVPSKESVQLHEPPAASPVPPPQRLDAAALLAEELQLLLDQPVAAAGRGAASPRPPASPGDELPLLLLEPEPAPAAESPGPAGAGASSPPPAGASVPAAAVSPAAGSLSSSDLGEPSRFERREPDRSAGSRPSRHTAPPQRTQGFCPSGDPAPADVDSTRAAPMAHAGETPPSAASASSDLCELTPAQRRRIDEMYAQLGTADAFTLLGVGPEHDKKAIQRAYFKLSKEFHPDRFFKKQLGPYRQRVAAVFQALTEARDLLVDEERRRRYLAGEPTS